MAPFVSVIIPTRDRPDMLREAINTVRAQTFTNHEIIVVINGPDNPLTPKSLEVANAAGYRIVRIEQAGIAVALNAGIKAAQGQWLAFLDDDDLWEPNKIEIEFKAADAAAADVVFCDFFIVDETSSIAAPPLRPPQSLSAREAMTLKNYGGGCSTTMVKRTAALAVGGFDESIVSPDWDMWMRLSWHYRVAWTDAHLVYVRHHLQNASKQISWAYWTLYIQRKALRTLPRDLRHLRSQILLQMLKVAMKGVEGYVRHNYLGRLRKLIRRTASAGK
jgi:glycosyltransferase involved in cell wall biosynthesis